MQQGKSVFAQIMETVPWRRFQTCVNRYKGDSSVQTFTCAEFFRVMIFAQLTYRESLRDIVESLNAIPEKMYHMGIRSSISRNNLSHAARTRNWRIFADFAFILIEKAKALYQDDENPIPVHASIYALDSSTISLCLSLFPWAPFRRKKAAVKLHTLLNLRGSIPEFILISSGKTHDVNAIDHMVFQPGAYYVMDRGYLDFERLYRIHQARSFFVIRAKRNTKLKRRRSQNADKTTGVQSDHITTLVIPSIRRKYPEPLRRVRYRDQDRDKRFAFLTNNFDLPAKTIADIYRLRWRVELFFKWIKQHLRIKAFYGVSENAVRSQIWIAVCAYLLVAIVKKELGLSASLHRILQVLSLTQFEKTQLFTMLQPEPHRPKNTDRRNCLPLFDL